MHAPMLIPLAGLIAGIMAGKSGAGLWASLSLILSACLFYILMLRLTRDPAKGFVRNKYHYIWIFILFSGIGVLSYDLNRPWQTDTPEDFIAAHGRILDIKQTTSGDRATVDVSTLYHKYGTAYQVDNLTVLVRSDAMRARTDDMIMFPVSMMRITDSDNYFSSGYTEVLNRKGIFYETLCLDDNMRITGHSASLRGIAQAFRYRLESFIERTPLEKGTQNFLITLLLGDRSYLDAGIRDIFSDAGISHILALSGMHVAIIAGIIMWLLFPINFFGLYRYRLLVSTILLVAYAFLTGCAPSTVRATIMAVTVMITVFLERKNSAWNALLLATFIILLFSPISITDVGLQLSFLCVASLIFFVNPLNPIDSHEHHRIHSIYATILATLSATFGTWCLVAWYFGTVPTMFLLANIVALPLLPIYLVLAVVYLSAFACGIRFGFLEQIVDFGPNALKGLLEWFGCGSGTALSFTPSLTSVWLWLAFVTSLAILLNCKKTRFQKWCCIATGCAFLVTTVMTANAVVEDDFIIQRGSGAVTVLMLRGGNEEIIKMPRQSVCGCTVVGKRIITVDCPIANMQKDSVITCDIMVMAGGIREELDDIVGKIRPGMIVIHPTVRRARESRIIHDADSLAIPYHSIRHSGPYRYSRVR